MGRPREFDEGVALEAAIKCFWRQGFEATTVRDLASEMGISTPSLCNTYGDKKVLFEQSLRHYRDRSARALITRLERSLSPKQAVRRFVEEIIERSVNDRERQGCLLVNSALEASRHKRLADFVASCLSEIEAFFYRSIKAAQTEGTVPQDRNAKGSCPPAPRCHAWR
jgi:TetR/AcrR family transcriptional regulator, transcriptional repressor for nem operon